MSEQQLPSPFAAGFFCRCPHCGKGPVFTGYITPVSRCAVCGTDLSFAASTEGPAVFIILIVGFVIVGAAAVVDGLFHPPPFVHLLLWIPGVVILSLALLRPFKATLIALHYQRMIHEGAA